MLMLMEEIKQLRERSGVLTDEERRKQAEAMVLKITSMMQIDDEGLDEDDDQEGYELMP